MRMRILLLIGLLFPAASSAQDPAGSSDGGKSEASPAYDSGLIEVQLDPHDSIARTNLVHLYLSGAEPPQHRILKGMGLSLRQVSDSLIYEHFPIADQTGMVAQDVHANLPAYKAGIRWHNVIAKVNGKPISSVEEFVKAYEEAKGDEVSIEFIHKGQLKKAAITKADVAKWEKDFKIGVHVEPISEQLALHLGFDAKQKPGLYISSIIEDSPAEKAGLKAGDLLMKANDTPLKSTDVLNNLVRESQGREMALEYVHEGKTRIVKLSPAEQPEPQWQFRQLSTNPSGWTISGLGHPYDLDQVLRQWDPNGADAATLERLIKAVEQLSKDVTQLKEELESKNK